jgi:hypothetical protein
LYAFQWKNFTLANELENLSKVLAVQACEATVFHAARILEFLAAAAVDRLSITPSANIFSNLATLQRYSLLSSPTKYWAHALRWMGNEVRHLHRALSHSDALLSAALVECWVEWFFFEYPFSPVLEKKPFMRGLEHLFSMQHRAHISPMVRLLRSVAEPVLFNPNDEEWKCLLPLTPVPAAALAEIQIDRGLLLEAMETLHLAQMFFPDNPRLIQLEALLQRRSGHPEEAVNLLAPFYEKSRDDDETIGILAGAYKAMWDDENSSDIFLLKKAHTVYREGWQRTKSTYLGINTAATALWKGKEELSILIAKEVAGLLYERCAILSKNPSTSDFILGFWEQVTMAEAVLLTGDMATARHLYVKAFHTHPEERGNMDSAKRQLAKHLAIKVPELGVDEFLSS